MGQLTPHRLGYANKQPISLITLAMQEVIDRNTTVPISQRRPAEKTCGHPVNIYSVLQYIPMDDIFTLNLVWKVSAYSFISQGDLWISLN